MKPLWLILPLTILLSACDGDTPSAPATDTTSPAIPEQTRDPAQSALAGVWQPQPDNGLQALVLADNGRLYLVGDDHHQGVSWQAGNNGRITLNYLLEADTGRAVSVTLRVEAGKTSLALEGNSPFAGHYRRTDSGIQSVSGEITLPDSAALPAHTVLAISLLDLGESSDTDTHARPVHSHLMRLNPVDGRMPFQLYLSDEHFKAGHRYGLRARVIAAGRVLLSSGPATPLSTGKQPVTLALHTPDQRSPALEPAAGQVPKQPPDATL